MRRFGYFVFGILVGATLKAEFKVTVQEVNKPNDASLTVRNSDD